jgi:hypothetical protein
MPAQQPAELPSAALFSAKPEPGLARSTAGELVERSACTWRARARLRVTQAEKLAGSSSTRALLRPPATARPRRASTRPPRAPATRGRPRRWTAPHRRARAAGVRCVTRRRPRAFAPVGQCVRRGPRRSASWAATLSAARTSELRACVPRRRALPPRADAQRPLLCSRFFPPAPAACRPCMSTSTPARCLRVLSAGARKGGPARPGGASAWWTGRRTGLSAPSPRRWLSRRRTRGCLPRSCRALALARSERERGRAA